MNKIFFILLLLVTSMQSFAQDPVLLPGGIGRRVNTSSTGQKDTTGFQQRDDLKDSITISYRYMDELRRYNIDSSVNDFDKYFPVPTSYLYMGNNGAAATPIIFSPF